MDQIVVKAILRSSRVIYCDNQCVKSALLLFCIYPGRADGCAAADNIPVAAIVACGAERRCFNALSRDSVNDDPHHFTAHELNGVYQTQ